MKVLNILRQAIDLKRAKVLITKVKRRVSRLFRKKGEDALEGWRERNLVNWEEYCKNIDKDLYEESVQFGERLSTKSERKLSKLDVDLGGGGIYVVLYFLTRLLQPECVVETGVAAGFSSSAILEAMNKNDKGHLYSSDFPYFREERPEDYIGILVDERNMDRWSLYKDGDQNNLPKIKRKVNRIDIFHYDSDKSYEGRNYAMSCLSDVIDSDTVIIYDDIMDNSHFFELSIETDRKCNVFEFEGKFVGMIGDAGGMVGK